MKLKKQIHKLLTMRLFRIITTVFTHGATHFIFLIIVGITTAYLWSMTDQDSIKPHSIDVHLGFISNYDESYRKLNLTDLPLDNVSINLMLNDKSIEDYTEGKYKNALEVEFDGKSVRRKISIPEDEDSSLLKWAKYKTVEFLDSVVLSVNSTPRIGNYASSCSLNPILYKDEPYVDSLGHRLVNVYKLTDTSVKYSTRMESDSSVTMHIAALDLKMGSPKHRAYIFSDDFGVKKDDPYYYYFISFPSVNFTGELRISFDISGHGLDKDANVKYITGKSLQYNYIYPEPDAVSNGKIEYFSDEKKILIEKNKGVIIQAVDIEAQNRQNKKSFIISVLVGTGFAFLLDIIIQLLKELRREQLRKEV